MGKPSEYPASSDSPYYLLSGMWTYIRKLRHRTKSHLSRLNVMWRERNIINLETSKVQICREKETLRIGFIVIFKASWKLDHLYSLLERDERFSPFVIISPNLKIADASATEEVDALKEFFRDKGCEFYVASRDDEANRILLKSLNMDVVVFDNPHGLTTKSLYTDLCESHLCCYIPYHIEIGKYGGNQQQYNRLFHNTAWRIFAPHDVSLHTYQKVGHRKGENVVVTGYPGLEPLISEKASADPWRPLGLKRIIWAPHHTIVSAELPYSNFLRYAEVFREMVDEYADAVQWCFKPHPLLKQRLFKHPDWGVEKTEEYFRFWADHANTQLEVGDYASLFRKSDAMIHDSGSFLAEYLYVDKPVMYLWSSPKVVEFFNSFGLEALDCCVRGDSASDIRDFINTVLTMQDFKSSLRQRFLAKHQIMIEETLPSDRILSELKSGLSGNKKLN